MAKDKPKLSALVSVSFISLSPLMFVVSPLKKAEGCKARVERMFDGMIPLRQELIDMTDQGEPVITVWQVFYRDVLFIVSLRAAQEDLAKDMFLV